MLEKERRRIENLSSSSSLTTNSASASALAPVSVYDASGLLQHSTELEGGVGKSSSTSGGSSNKQDTTLSLSSLVASELSIAHDELQVTQMELGRGSFGIVHRCRWRGMDVAVKCLIKSGDVASQNEV